METADLRLLHTFFTALHTCTREVDGKSQPSLVLSAATTWQMWPAAVGARPPATELWSSRLSRRRQNWQTTEVLIRISHDPSQTTSTKPTQLLHCADSLSGLAWQSCTTTRSGARAVQQHFKRALQVMARLTDWSTLAWPSSKMARCMHVTCSGALRMHPRASSSWRRSPGCSVLSTRGPLRTGSSSAPDMAGVPTARPARYPPLPLH